MKSRVFEVCSRLPVRGLALCLFLALPSGSALAQDDEDAHGTYQIGAGDELHIVVWRNEELTMTVPVRPDGWVSLPLVNDIEVIGLTPMQVRDKIVRELREFVSEPLVSVIVARVGSFKVSILGNVRQPGRYNLEGRPTVLDVLALAGGPDEFADTNDMYLLRRSENRHERIGVRYDDAVGADGSSVNVDVKPGDIIIVP